jgi:hypothetical protein
MSGDDQQLITLGQVAECLTIDIQEIRLLMDDDDEFPEPIKVDRLRVIPGGPNHGYLWRLADVMRYGALRGRPL